MSIYFPKNCGDCSEFQDGNCTLMNAGRSKTQKCADPCLAENRWAESISTGERVLRVVTWTKTWEVWGRNVIPIFKDR